MKKIFSFFLAVLCAAGTARVQAQNVGIGTTNPQQKLHVAGGLRLDTLSNGKDSGLLRHNADGTVFSLAFNGDSTQVLRGNGTFGAGSTTSVIPFGLVTNPWLLGGNAGVTPATNFLGTTDNAALRFRINNQWAGHMDSVSQSTFLGYGAGKNDTAAAVGNTAMGYLAFNSASTGIFNTAMGVRVLPVNTSGSQNTAIGMQALQQNTTGGNNVAVGLNSLNVNSSGSHNTAVGVQALNFNTTGNYNVGIGRSAGWANSSGTENITIGHQALFANGTGSNNIAIGTRTLYNDTLCTQVIAIGDSALFSMTSNGYENTAIGYKAMFATTGGTGNTALGWNNLVANNNGTGNTAIGAAVMVTNINGSNNDAFGQNALYANTSGNFNSAIGTSSLMGNTSGSGNVALGYLAASGNTTGTQITALGYDANVASSNLTNATVLGSGAFVDASNKVRIGNSSVTVIEGQVLPTTPSDGRFKFNIREDVKGLDFILRLRPVSYQFDVRKFDEQASNVSFARYANYDQALAMRRTGFIAQEVEKAAVDCGYTFTGVIRPSGDKGHYGLSYEAFIMPMVKAMQEQQNMITALQTENSELKKRLDAIEARLTK